MPLSMFSGKKNLSSEAVNSRLGSWKTVSLSASIARLFFITAPFNNMQTLKFKAQPTNVFFATISQMLGGSSQLPTTAESCSYHETS